MKKEKFENLYATYINGNLEDFKIEIRKLNKKSTFEFLDSLWIHTLDVSKIINYLANNL